MEGFFYIEGILKKLYQFVEWRGKIKETNRNLRGRLLLIIKDKTIDGGKGFDWGKISSEYAKYGNIYPQEFYQKIIDFNVSGTLIIKK